MMMKRQPINIVRKVHRIVGEGFILIFGLVIENIVVTKRILEAFLSSLSRMMYQNESDIVCACPSVNVAGL